MYKFNVIVDSDVFQAFREQSALYPREVKDFMQGEIVPYTEEEVADNIAPYPDEAYHPFEFTTEKSQRYYFWAVKQGIIPSDGERYIRQDELLESWRVTSDRRSESTFIGLENTAPHAVYVYGSGILITSSKQVPGHKRTGWGKDLDDKIILLSEDIQGRVIIFWYDLATRIKTKKGRKK